MIQAIGDAPGDCVLMLPEDIPYDSCGTYRTAEYEELAEAAEAVEDTSVFVALGVPLLLGIAAAALITFGTRKKRDRDGS